VRRTTVVLAAVCLLGGVACGGESKPKASPTSSSAPPVSESPSASPTPTATEASITYGAPFYSDDFSDKSKGWTQKDTDQVQYVVHDDYASPLYTINVKAPSLHVFPHPEFRGVKPEQLESYEVSALLQTTLATGHTDLFGLTCRDLDDQRYSFAIGYDLRRTGQIPWRISEHGPDGARVLAEGTSPAPGGSAFRVAATCAGGQDGGPAHLILKVNDTEIGRTTDAESPLTKGYAGAYVRSDDGKTTVNVMNFSVRSATIAS